MAKLLLIPRPTEAEHKLYSRLKASHTAVLHKQQAIGYT